MRFLQVTDRIHAVFHVDGLVRHHLDLLTLQDAFGLFGDHVGDARLPGVEVVIHLVHLVAGTALGHLRKAVPFSREGVQLSAGIHRVGGHVKTDIIGRELHVLVGDRSAAVIVDEPVSVGKIRYNGVLGGGEGRPVERTLVQHVQGVLSGLGNGIGPRQGIPHPRLEGIFRTYQSVFNHLCRCIILVPERIQEGNKRVRNLALHRNGTFFADGTVAEGKLAGIGKQAGHQDQHRYQADILH